MLVFEVLMKLTCLLFFFFAYFVNQADCTFSCINPDPTKFYSIVNVRSNLVLGVLGNSLNNNSAVWQQTDDGFSSQLWSFQIINTTAKTVKIINSYSGLALTSPAKPSWPVTSSQTTLDPSRTDQIFQIIQGANGCYIKVYPFTYYLTISNCTSIPSLAETWWYCENQTFCLNNAACTNCQQFVYNEASSCPQPNPSKYYKIRNVRSQLVLGVVGSSMTVNSSIWQDTDNGLFSQLWSFQIVNAVNQTYKIINVYTGLAFTSEPTFTGPSFQTPLDPSRTDQIFQLVQGPHGCYIKAYPFSHYLTISWCVSTASQVESYPYTETNKNWINCQQFRIEPTSCSQPNPSTYYKIVNIRSQLILGVKGASTASNAQIWQDVDNGYYSQLWSFQLVDPLNQTYRIVNAYSVMAITSPPGYTGTPNTYQSTIVASQTNQIFQLFPGPDGCFIKVYPFTNYLTIAYCTSKANFVETFYYYENNAYCTPNCSDCQQFVFKATTTCSTPDPTKYYKIMNVRSHLVLGVVNDSLNNNSQVWQLTDTGSNVQIWSFKTVNANNKMYNIINNRSNLALTSTYAYPNAKSSFQTNLDSSRTDQIFQLIQGAAGCYLKVSSNFTQYLTVGNCFVIPEQVETWPYTETVSNWTYCQQFVLIPTSQNGNSTTTSPSFMSTSSTVDLGPIKIAVQQVVNQSAGSSLACNSAVNSMTPYVMAQLPVSEKVQLGNLMNDTIRYCFFDGQPCNMQRDFTTVYDSSLDNCFTFNYPSNSLYNVNGVGSNFGLRMILHSAIEDVLDLSMSDGFKIYIHDPTTYPFMDNFGYSVALGFQTSFILEKESFFYLPIPYGTCVPNVDSSYLYPGNYTTEGCYRSCYAINVAKSCGCADPSYPLPNGTSYCDISKKSCIDYYAECKRDDITSSCNCAFPCSDEIFTPSITRYKMHDPSFVAQYCSSNKNNNISFSECSQYARKSFATITVFFQTTKVISYEEAPAYTVTNVLNDFSNVLGLFLGVDVSPIAEVIVLFGFVIVHLVQKITSHR